jgi:hypothetical protein
MWLFSNLGDGTLNDINKLKELMEKASSRPHPLSPSPY